MNPIEPENSNRAPRTRDVSTPSLRDSGRDIRDQLKEGASAGVEKSDPPIVVRDGRTDHTAKGRAGEQREQSTHVGKRLFSVSVSSSLLALGRRIGHFVADRFPCARFPEEPGAVIPHAGISEGGTGQ